MSHTFFTITVPGDQNPRDWAKRKWDTYGFDYDNERFGTNTVCAWPLEEDGGAELKSALEEDDITYDTFQVDDLAQFFR